jgi:heme/copper-type cytochrome/quinol oxidase subunit 1
MRQYTQTDFLFTITGGLILLIGQFFSNSILDIAIHDTYLLISYMHVAIILCASFLFFAFIYFILKKVNKPLYSVLGWTHYCLTVLPLLSATVINFTPNRHFANQNFNEEMANAERYNVIIVISVLLCILGQFLFVVNIIASLLKRKVKR